jgi:quercetin dioxygenase-like cupin family protein
MPRQEAQRWNLGELTDSAYERALKRSKERQQKQEASKKVIKAEEMPWDHSRQGRLKHMAQEDLGLRWETMDIYMQEIPPGSRSGKHRHMAEECLFVLEGRGYDLHWDPSIELKDRYYWKFTKEPSKWEWEEGDVVYIPPNTIHQHFNANPDKPARFISAQNRIYRWAGYDDLEQLEDAPEDAR